MVAFPKILMEDEPWSEAWEPTPEILAWFKNFMSKMAEGSTWAAPGSQHIYKISHATKMVTLMHGDPHDPKHWHDKNKKSLAALGYTVLDGPKSSGSGNEFALAENLVVVLLEDGTSPFTKTKVTLQYRPFKLKDDWKWFWVLLPDDHSKALAHGQEDNRSKASVAARQKARGLNVLIGKVDVIEPYSQEQP